MTKKATNAEIAIGAAGRKALETIELDGMPEREIVQTIRYTVERTTFVEKNGRRDVGDHIDVKRWMANLEFEIVKVVHTVKDGNDVYQATAIEIL